MNSTLMNRNYKVVANYPATVGHSHSTVRVEWQRTTATGQKAGIAVCECGAEQRIMQYAKDVRRKRRQERISMNTQPYKGIAPRQTAAQRADRAMRIAMAGKEYAAWRKQREAYYRDLIRKVRADKA